MEVELGDGVNVTMKGVHLPGDSTMIYPCYRNLENKIEERLQEVKDIQLRSDDVIITSYPRSGTHWLYQIVTMLLKQKAELEETPMTDNMPELISDQQLEALKNKPAPRIICSHLTLQQFSEQLPEVKPRLVYALRNPKDALVSGYQISKGLNYEKLGFSGTWDEYFQIGCEGGGIYYGGWYHHVKAVEEFCLQHPDCPVHIVNYEDMKQHTEEMISRVARDLGCGEAIAADVAKASDLSNMKNSVANAKVSVHFTSKDEGIIRKGQIGRWQELFTDSQRQKFDSVFEEKMAKSKLAEIVRAYV